MKITLTSTDRMTDLNGVPARIWEGRTDAGTPIFALITRVGVNRSQDCAPFERELREVHAPCSAEVSQAIPMRMIL